MSKKKMRDATPLEQDLIRALTLIVEAGVFALEHAETRGAEYGRDYDTDGTKRHENAYKVGSLTQGITQIIQSANSQLSSFRIEHD